MMNFHKEAGQSLIEIVVAVGILAVVLVGVSDLISRTLNLSTFQKDKNVSISIIEEQFATYRFAKDSDPADFFANLENYDDCVGVDPKYSCSISYTAIDDKGVLMSVRVSWYDGSTPVETVLSTILTKKTR